MLTFAEQAAPSWLPVVLLLIPVTIMFVLFRAGFRYRVRQAKVRRAEARLRPVAETEVGSAGTITDPSEYSCDALLKALATRPEDDQGWSEDAFAKMLGLRARIASGGAPYPEPHILWGEREHGQVFIRLGADARAAAGLSMSARHFRHICVLRVAAPRFELASEDGALYADDSAPAEVRALIASLAPSQIAWHQTRLAAGPEGIVTTRPAVDPLAMGWLYDLWLCERITTLLALAPLTREDLGPEWRVPYALDKTSTPKFARAAHASL
jgi:hypothetical protein